MRAMGPNSPPLTCELHSDFLPMITGQAEGEGNFTVEKPGKHGLWPTWSNRTSSVAGHADHVYPRYDTMRNGTLPLCSSCQEPINPSLIVRVKHRTNSNCGTFNKKYLKSIPENCHGHLNKGSLKNCHCLEEPKDT